MSGNMHVFKNAISTQNQYEIHHPMSFFKHAKRLRDAKSKNRTLPFFDVAMMTVVMDVRTSTVAVSSATISSY